jgi:hypothetical protein
MALDPKYLLAEQLGIRLETVGGLAIWEAAPVYRHQKAVDRIRASIHPRPGSTCGCIHASDIYVQFTDGSLKRPDIALFCREPDEQDDAVKLLPEAVIEVVSRGYEAKDLEIAPRFYLSQGVKDVVVFDPSTLLVLHVTATEARRLLSPATIELACGCACTA